jgi:hypothetical protein
VNKVTLNWQRPLWERDQKVVKRSVRDKPVWVAKHKCMEAALVISLHNYLYLKLAKMLSLSYYLLYFLFNKIREQEGQGKGGRGRKGKVPQTMYTHESKCKNNKRKERKKSVIHIP